MQVIKFLDKEQNGNVVIKALDETHVFVHKHFSAPTSRNSQGR